MASIAMLNNQRVSQNHAKPGLKMQLQQDHFPAAWYEGIQQLPVVCSTYFASLLSVRFIPYLLLFGLNVDMVDSILCITSRHIQPAVLVLPICLGSLGTTRSHPAKKCQWIELHMMSIVLHTLVFVMVASLGPCLYQLLAIYPLVN